MAAGAVCCSLGGRPRVLRAVSPAPRRYLFQIDADGDPLEAAPVLERRALPPAVRPVDHVLDRVPVLVVQVVAHLIEKSPR